MLIDLRYRPISDFAAGVVGTVRGRKHLRDSQRLRANQRGGKDIIHVGRGQSLVAIAGRLPGAEIALKHLSGGDKSSLIGGILARDGALVTREEEKFVLLDGAADSAAELVALQSVALGREEIASVQVAIAKKLESVAVEGVRSGFDHRVDGSRGMQSILCGQGAGLHLKLFQSVREWEGKIGGVERIVVQGSVQKVTDPRQLPARDCNVLAAGETSGTIDSGGNRWPA